MDFPEHPFWDFALQVYKCEGVGVACIRLQERHGVDVNLMLFCLWLGESSRGVLDAHEMDTLCTTSDRWHNTVVKSLRAVRQGLKTDFPDVPDGLRESLRAQVQATEIDAEHLEQLLLAGAVDRPAGEMGLPPESRASDANGNFKLYLSTLGAIFEPADSVNFAHILGQAFPGLAPERALDLAELLM
jgi:uncharacterized protein (TIGR02444 family)